MINSRQMMNSVKNSVLIVDDAETNVYILTLILENDYTVYTASGGKRALEIIDEKFPDLILLDIRMPDLNGFDVLKILKESEKNKNIPIIIISGLEDPENEEKGLDLGAVDYIQKPFNSKVIKLKVRHQLQIVNQFRAIEQYVSEKELANSDMRKLQKKLELAIENAQAANKAKTSFLASMSHEIRTPLNAVVGISEMQLQNHNLSTDAKEAFTRINNSGELLMGIINDILDISKIEAGMLDLTQEQYDVFKMISDTVYLNTIKHEDKPIEFILNINENVPSQVFGDVIRIRQILNNLLSNAFKYTSSGEVELSLNSENISGNDNLITLVFNVRDTGQGMTQEQLSKIFDEYSRFNLDENKAIVGTGLGMGITQNLIRLMNGQIQAESKKDSGSLFTVRIPQGNVNAPPLGKEAVEKLQLFKSSNKPNENKVQITRSPIPFGKVLVVDDIDMNIYVAKGLLSPYGLQIDTAANGFEAIEKIKKSYAVNNLYDIIFMDHIMPVMNGIETTKKIRELGYKYRNLPVIALTANVLSAMKDTLAENGFNGFLSKPINIKELDAVLREWISPEKLNKKENITHTEIITHDKFYRALNKIDEINIEKGLSHVMNNKDSYHDTLERFFHKLTPECDKMSEYLKNEDLNNFLISIHSMKTMLAIIGASDLSETAYTLQAASSDQDINFCKSGFVEFKNSLLSLHDKLKNLYPAADTKAKDNQMPQTRPALKDVYKALVVDDVEMILNILTMEFEEYGLKADTASSGREAIEKAMNNDYDIIFIDYYMPEMDGIETALRIRNWEAETNAKSNIIIAISSDIDSKKKKLFMDNGFNGSINKPVVPEEIKEILKIYCKSLHK